MAYTETTTTGYGKRLSNSAKGIFGGIIAFIAGTILLFWNEGRFVNRRATIGEAERKCVAVESVAKIDKDLNGEVIHATAMANTTNTLTDAEFGVSAVAIKLKRNVEYYQWKENKETKKKDNVGGSETTTTTYTYRKEWVGAPVDSSEYKEAAEHKNTTLVKIDDMEEQAEDVTFGAYRLPSFLVKKIGGSVPVAVSPSEAQINTWNNKLGVPVGAPGPGDFGEEAESLEDLDDEYFAAESKPAAVAAAETPVAAATQTAAAAPSGKMLHIEGNTVYFGANPDAPQIGDVRVTLTKTPPAEVSIIAQVKGTTFTEYVSEKTNGRVSSLAMGDKSMGAMFADLYFANSMWTWILRLVGMLLVIGGLKGIFGIVTTLLKVLPFLSDIVGVGIGLVCGVVGFAWSLLVISSAWLTYRPIIGVPLLIISIAGIVYLKKVAKTKKAAA